MKKFTDYFGIDGLVHIIVLTVIVRVVSWFLPLWAAVIVAAAIGMGKELVWDRWLRKGTCEKKDLIADALGIIIGCL